MPSLPHGASAKKMPSNTVVAMPEPVTCANLDAVNVGAPVAAGTIKLVSEGTFASRKVLVVQAHNSSWYHARKDEPDFASELVELFAAERDHLRSVQDPHVALLLGGCWDVAKPWQTTMVVEYLEVCALSSIRRRCAQRRFVETALLFGSNIHSIDLLYLDRYFATSLNLS